MINLLERIETFLTDSRMTASAFGRECMNDPSFVFEMRNGRSYTSKTAQRVLGFIEKQNEKATQ